MIRLTRGSSYADRIRAYKVFIDDVYRGDIKANETIDYAVNNGNHVIYAKIDWCGSNKVDVNINNSICELEIGSSLAGGKFWIPFYTLLLITFFRNKYLWIKLI